MKDMMEILQAIELAGDKKAVILMALDDPALEAVWAEIGES
ncbi:MAG TPA: hypothetical protein VFB72_15110 [Verrucomicrobiae bacterium]|nr:hypothetical protein [Verrucomicrobiae bacterium]